MSGNAEQAIKEFRLKVKQRSLKITRMSLLDLFSAIVIDTPVDEGFLRNGWFCSFENPREGTPIEPSKSGQETIDAMTSQVDQLTEGVHSIYFVNNFVYGPRIEFDGHSGKAPQGMVRVNTIRWDTIVENNVRKFGD